MSNKPWIDEYEPREWAVYKLPVESTDKPTLSDPSEDYCVCSAESERARQHWELSRRTGHSHRHFYPDFEQIAADQEVYGGSGPSVLAEDWRGHPAGSLVYLSFNGVMESPQKFTYMIEQQPATS